MSSLLPNRCLACQRQFRTELLMHTHIKEIHNRELSSVEVRIEPLGSEHSFRFKRRRISDEIVISEIPSPAPSLEIGRYRIKTPFTKDRIVFFDLETGGLARNDDILQISAIRGDHDFNTYALPTKPIAKRASSVNHITYDGQQLYHRDNPVNAKNIYNALEDFINYLQQFDGKVILAAHNVNFDRRFIMESLLNYNLYERFAKKVNGFLDTIPIFRQCFPRLPSYRQEYLVQHFLSKSLQDSYDSHNALDDVIYLQKLFHQVLIAIIDDKQIDISNFSYTAEFAYHKHIRQINTNKHLSSFYQLIKNNILSESMAKKLSGEDINFQHLHSLYKIKGESGIKEVFTQMNADGKPRITNSETIIEKFFQFFRKF